MQLYNPKQKRYYQVLLFSTKPHWLIHLYQVLLFSTKPIGSYI